VGAIQLSLLERALPAPKVDPAFRELHRKDLGEGAWVDYAPRWLLGDTQVYDVLLERSEWSEGRRLMYERFVDVPRLMGKLPEDGGHAIVHDVADILSRRYDARFDALSVALYRHGRDSVAWHADKGLRDQPESTLALVSLGEPRPFRLRPVGGGSSIGFSCGWGDLVVLGGTIQRHWEHAIPKVKHAGPRMVLMLRCTRDTRLG